MPTATTEIQTPGAEYLSAPGSFYSALQFAQNVRWQGSSSNQDRRLLLVRMDLIGTKQGSQRGF